MPLLYKGQTYNGFSQADINTEKGCTKLGIQNMRNGYVTRGILIDMPRLKGLPYLEPGTPVFVEDIEAWEKKAGIKVSAGDALLLRTGRWARRTALGPWTDFSQRGRLPCLGGAVAEGARRRAHRQRRGARRGAVAGARVNLPVHTLAITALGLNILDNQDLEAVGDLAARQKRWEFLLTVAPVPVVGGTGFPVNAIATF